jgi:hypothetical protein
VKKTAIVGALIGLLACYITALLISGRGGHDGSSTKLQEQKDDACQRARARAITALYKLRPDAAAEVKIDGISQSLELEEWMRYCDQTPVDIRTSPNVDEVRRKLLQFSQLQVESRR